MPSFEDVMEYEKEVTHQLERFPDKSHLRSDGTDVSYVLVIGLEAIVHAILAVGVRIDYSISQFNRKEWPNRNA